MKYNKIALIGMMGCGKSTVAKVLSEKLKINLFESDNIFEEKFSIKIKDYFSLFGENKFRIEETKILEEILKNDNFVLSTGGGIILSEKNRELLFSEDILSIYLKTSADEIYNRIKKDKTRPLLLVENPKEEIVKILNSRKDFYSMAKFEILTDNKTINEITDEIVEKINENN